MTLKQATEAVEKARWSEAVKITNGLKKAGVSCRPKTMDAYLQESCDALVKRCEGAIRKGVVPMAGEADRTRLYAAMTSQISWIASEEERKTLEEGLLDMIKCEKHMERIVDRLTTAFRRRKGRKNVLVEQSRLQPVFDRLYDAVTAHKNQTHMTFAKPKNEPSDFDGSHSDIARAVLQRINAPFAVSKDGRREDRGEGHPVDTDPLTQLIDAEDRLQAEKEMVDKLLTKLVDAKKRGDNEEYDRIRDILKDNDQEKLLEVLENGSSGTQQ